MDKIFIEQLTIVTCIGVYAWEQQIRQKLLLDIEMDWDTRAAASSDDVHHCLDYLSVSEAVIQHVQSGRFALVERVAQEVADLLINRFHTRRVRIKVSKPGAIAEAKTVGVIIERAVNKE